MAIKKKSHRQLHKTEISFSHHTQTIVRQKKTSVWEKKFWLKQLNKDVGQHTQEHVIDLLFSSTTICWYVRHEWNSLHIQLLHTYHSVGTQLYTHTAQTTSSANYIKLYKLSFFFLLSTYLINYIVLRSFFMDFRLCFSVVFSLLKSKWMVNESICIKWLYGKKKCGEHKTCGLGGYCRWRWLLVV